MNSNLKLNFTQINSPSNSNIFINTWTVFFKLISKFTSSQIIYDEQQKNRHVYCVMINYIFWIEKWMVLFFDEFIKFSKLIGETLFGYLA